MGKLMTAEAVAQSTRLAAALDVLDEAESFISGFEGDELQEGVDVLLGRIRALIAGEQMPARKAIVEVSGGVAEVTECPDGVEVEIIDHDNLDDEPSPCRQHKDTGRGVCCYCGVAI